MRWELALLCVAGCGRFAIEAAPTEDAGEPPGATPDGGAKDASAMTSSGGTTPKPEVDAGPPCSAAPVLAFDVAGGAVRNVGSAGTNVTGKVLVWEGFPTLVDSGPIGPNAPASTQTSSLDFGDTPIESDGVRSVDFANSTLGQAITGPLLTITGWLQMSDDSSGAGGNRLISSLNGTKGIELVQSGQGLRLGVNGFADLTGAPQSGDHLAVRASGPVTAADWSFFAVTYDGKNTSKVSFFFGDGNTLATFDTSATYTRGSINPSDSVSLGNFAVGDARNDPDSSSRVPRGRLHGVRVFTRILSLDDIRCEQTHAR